MASWVGLSRLGWGHPDRRSHSAGLLLGLPRPAFLTAFHTVLGALDRARTVTASKFAIECALEGVPYLNQRQTISPAYQPHLRESDREESGLWHIQVDRMAMAQQGLPRVGFIAKGLRRVGLIAKG